MKRYMKELEHLLSLGGIKKDIIMLAISGVAVVCSLLKFQPFPFDMAWIAIIFCGLPIILEAIIGLVTAFDIRRERSGRRGDRVGADICQSGGHDG